MNDFGKILKALSFTSKMLKLTRVILFASMGVFILRIFFAVLKVIK